MTFHDQFLGKSVIIVAGSHEQGRHVVEKFGLVPAAGWRVKVVVRPEHLRGIHWLDPYVIWWGSWYKMSSDDLYEIRTMLEVICATRRPDAPPWPVPTLEDVEAADADLAALEDELRSEPELTDP